MKGFLLNLKPKTLQQFQQWFCLFISRKGSNFFLYFISLDIKNWVQFCLHLIIKHIGWWQSEGDKNYKSHRSIIFPHRLLLSSLQIKKGQRTLVFFFEFSCILDKLQLLHFSPFKGQAKKLNNVKTNSRRLHIYCIIKKSWDYTEVTLFS